MICLALAAGRPAYGEAFSAHELENIEDVEALSLGELLEQPVTSASRYAQRPADSPTLVSTVDRDTIEAFGYRTLGEALRGMRGVYTSNDRNYSYLGTRGFSVPGDYNSRFALSIDNHRVNDALYGQASTGAELGIPMIAVERVELIRGGAWTVHGENALLGAIQVITATGATRPGIHVTSTTRATAESFDDPANRPAVASRGEDVAASYGAVEHGVDVFVAGAYSYDPGLAALYMPELAAADAPCVGRLQQPRSCDGVVFGGDAEEVGSLYAAVNTKHFTFHSLASRRRKRVPTAAFDTLIGDSIQTFDNRVYADLEAHRTTARTDVVARVAGDYYGYAGTYPTAGDVEPYLNIDHGSATWWTGELRGRYKLPHLGEHLRDVEVALVGEAVRASASQANGDQLPTGFESYLDRVDVNRTLSLGGHVSARAFDHVVGFAAVRGDYHPDSFGGTVNPQTGIVLDGDDLGRIRASYSRGYRAPNPYERFYNADLEHVAVDLEPERSSTTTLSVERYLGARMRLLVVGFQQDVQHLIQLTDDGDDGTSRFANTGGVTSYGVETELEGRWDRIHLRASYVRQYTRTDTGGVPANSPGSVASLLLVAPIAGGRADVGVESFYVNERLGFDRSPIAPLFTTNLALTIHKLAAELDLALGITNLFDERSGDPGSEEHRQSSIPHDPRTVWLRLSLALDH